MRSYVDFIMKHRKILFIAFVVLNLIAIVGITQIKLNTDFSLFTTDNSIYEQRIEELEENFGTTDQIIVLVESNEFTNDVKTTLRSLQVEFETMTDISSVQGPTPDGGMVDGVYVAIEDISPEALEGLYENFDEFSPIKVIDDVYYFSFTLLVDDTFTRDDMKQVEATLEDSTLPYYIAGDTYNQFKIVDYILMILFILPPLAILTILLVFRWQIGSFKPTIMSVVPAAIGSIWTFGIIGFLGNEVSILTAVVPIFIIVIGSADGLHFMSHYQEAQMEGLSVEKGMSKTLHTVGIPMIITTLTSMAGFLSLLSMNTESIVDLAVFASLGIFLAGVATWYVLPLVLSGGVNVTPKHTHKDKIKISTYIKKAWGVPSLIVIVGLILFAVLFTPQINHEFDMLSVYKDYTVVSKNAQKLSDVNGGSIPLYITVESDDIISMDTMNDIDLLVTELEASPAVSKVMNPYHIFQLMYYEETGFDIPNDLFLRMIYTGALNNEQLAIDTMFNEENGVMRLMVFPVDMDNDTLGEIESIVDNHSDTVTITGVQFLLRELNLNISIMQRNSILLAIGIVLLMLLISLRDIKLAILSIIPIIVTIGSIYGIMGLVGINLNITTVIIFSISIGVGIDYAVHYSSVYKQYYRETGHKQESIDRSYKHSSRPIIANALGISLGLSVMLFSPLTIHMNVSILMWVGMIVSVFVTLTFIPTVLQGITKKGE